MYFELVIIGIGMIYGFLKTGKENRVSLLKRGLFIGIMLGIVLIILGISMGGYMMMGASSIVGVVIFLEVMIVTVFFIIGTLIGDFLEYKMRP